MDGALYVVGAAEFQSTLPARGATDARVRPASQHTHFNPRSPHGERPFPCLAARAYSNFNPRSPHGERPSTLQGTPRKRQFQSTLPARGATRYHFFRRLSNVISIHAPRTGSDGILSSPTDERRISIHAPRTGSDKAENGHKKKGGRFQSTLPARGATPARGTNEAAERHFNPRSPHGERRRRATKSTRPRYFNPRSPHGERPSTLQGTPRKRQFQSTLPARGATRPAASCHCAAKISIHAPRTGSDERRIDGFNCRDAFQSTLPARGATPARGTNEAAERHFNPRSPHGERPGPGLARKFRAAISIHAPRTGSDPTPQLGGITMTTISIHAPRTGSDRSAGRCPLLGLFQSTLPARGATLALDILQRRAFISIHAPRTGSDAPTRSSRSSTITFQSTLPARGATRLPLRAADHDGISIHAPRTGSDVILRWIAAPVFVFQSTLPARGATSTVG